MSTADLTPDSVSAGDPTGQFSEALNLAEHLRDALAHPPVAVRVTQVLVARHHLLADRDHLPRRQAGVDPQVAQPEQRRDRVVQHAPGEPPAEAHLLAVPRPA